MLWSYIYENHVILKSNVLYHKLNNKLEMVNEKNYLCTEGLFEYIQAGS